MKTTKSGNKSNTNGQNMAGGKKSLSRGSTKAAPGMQSSQLMKLFEEELKDIYWAEKALTKAIPKMIKNATSPELIQALSNHLEETERQVERVEQVFEVL